MSKKKQGLIDKVLHGDHEREAMEDQAQESQESEAVLAKPQARKGRPDPVKDYAEHPKFAKFKGEKK
jgi:hypothetical protein